jgi:hypothetical protein
MIDLDNCAARGYRAGVVEEIFSERIIAEARISGALGGP